MVKKIGRNKIWYCLVISDTRWSQECKLQRNPCTQRWLQLANTCRSAFNEEVKTDQTAIYVEHAERMKKQFEDRGVSLAVYTR